jgi:uncharacterized membrane protein
MDNSPMLSLALASALFLGLHVLVSGTKLRDAIVKAIGERPYIGAFSLTSLVAIIWMAVAYNHAALAENEIVWSFGPGVAHLGIPLVLLAFLLGVTGLLTPNPTAVGAGQLLDTNDPARGITRITRHPFMWGVVIWSAFHLFANGDRASILFFGTFFVVALSGATLIDAKRRRAYGERWSRFAQKTSNVPFAAIFTGRNTLKIGEIGWWRFLAAVGVFLAVLFLHPWLFSASPFPGGWTPY